MLDLFLLKSFDGVFDPSPEGTWLRFGNNMSKFAVSLLAAWRPVLQKVVREPVASAACVRLSVRRVF